MTGRIDLVAFGAYGYDKGYDLGANHNERMSIGQAIAAAKPTRCLKKGTRVK